MKTRKQLDLAEEEAIEVVWWYRSDPDEPMAQAHYQTVEETYPGLFASLDRSDTYALARWEGRLATLRWLRDSGSESWDAVGRFDS